MNEFGKGVNEFLGNGLIDFWQGVDDFGNEIGEFVNGVGRVWSWS